MLPARPSPVSAALPAHTGVRPARAGRRARAGDCGRGGQAAELEAAHG